LIQGDISEGRLVVALSEGIAILEEDCLDIVSFVSDAIMAMPSSGSSPSFRSHVTRVVQLLRHSIFPADTGAYGHFLIKGPFVFQRGRLLALRGKDQRFTIFPPFLWLLQYGPVGCSSFAALHHGFLVTFRGGEENSAWPEQGAVHQGD
jgi:hypothetical protein